MAITRRGALATIGGAIFTPYISKAQGGGARSFIIERDGREIGSQTNTVELVGDTLRHQVRALIDFTILGITWYEYELNYVEEWRGGQLMKLDSNCDDDGAKEFARVTRSGDMLEIDGSGYQGVVDGAAATTSYVAQPLMARPTWISTQSGEPLQMISTARGDVSVPTQGGSTQATRYSMSGGYEVDLYYRDGEWVAVSFDAQGEIARYVPDQVDPTFAPAWAANA